MKCAFKNYIKIHNLFFNPLQDSEIMKITRELLLYKNEYLRIATED